MPANLSNNEPSIKIPKIDFTDTKIQAFPNSDTANEIIKDKQVETSKKATLDTIADMIAKLSNSKPPGQFSHFREAEISIPHMSVIAKWKTTLAPNTLSITTQKEQSEMFERSSTVNTAIQTSIKHETATNNKKTQPTDLITIFDDSEKSKSSISGIVIAKHKEKRSANSLETPTMSDMSEPSTYDTYFERHKKKQTVSSTTSGIDDLSIVHKYIGRHKKSKE